MTLHLPEPGTLDPASLLLTLVALMALIRFRIGLLPVIGIGAVLDAACYVVTGG